jgi:hypothetical protein
MSRIIGFLFFVLINAGAANAQTITNGDGSALQLNYCYEEVISVVVVCTGKMALGTSTR